MTWVLLDLGVAYEYVFLSRIFTRGILNFLVGLYFLRKVANLQYSEYLSMTFVPIVKGSLIPFLIVILLVCLFDSGSVGKVVLNTLVFEIASVVFIVRYGLSFFDLIFNYTQNPISFIVRQSISNNKHH